MRPLFCAFFVALVLLPPTGTAADADGKFAVRGAGFATCEHYLRAHQLKANEWHVFYGWLDGYISGLNEKAAGTYDSAPWQSTELIAEIVRNACSRDAAQHFFPLVRSALAGMQEQRLVSAQQKAPVEVGQQAVLVYPGVLRRAQEALARGGHFKGTPDGVFSPSTQAAIESFQTRNGIPVTGLPGPVTLWALLVEGLQ